jgi:tetratricopeptide (TPR) repeat protein
MAMERQKEANRYVQLTETGFYKLHAVRRRFGLTVEDIVSDSETPSVNTVKRAIKRGPVFVNTLERIWGFFQRLGAERKETLPDLVEGEDYLFVEGEANAGKTTPGRVEASGPTEGRKGWISRLTPRPNRLFTGRRDLLDRLHTSLQAGPAALVPDPQALTGLGGIGKTQTAIAYIYRHWRDYSRVFWVSAETVSALHEGLAGLAEELNLLEGAPATKVEALRRMYDWFRVESGWLLVLDNADDLETLAPHFPRHHTGSLLLTTRSRNTVQWAAPLQVFKLPRKEGALLLLRRTGILDMSQALEDVPPDVVQAALELTDELDGLPLALHQAGAYLAETPITVPEYLERYRGQGLELLERAEDRDHASVTVTFRLALEQIKRRVPYGQAAEALVRLCAFLSPDAIPEAIFTAYPFAKALPALTPGQSDYYSEVCATACAYSLISRDATHKTLSLHRLVQQAMRETMRAEERRAWAEEAVSAVAEATPDFEFEDWPLCDLLLPHWRICALHIREANIETSEAAYLLYQAGRYLRARALYGEAEGLLCQAIAIAERVHGPVHGVLADYLDDLACLYRVLDRGEEAERLHRRALEIIETVAGPDHVLVASKLHNMAVFYVHQEDYATAEALFLRALRIHEQQPRPDDALVATALTQLAGVYRSQGQFAEAEDCCLRALAIYERTLEPDHIDIATGCNNLGLLYLTMGRYGEAEPLYLRALAINETRRGKEHPETGTVLWGLARVRWKQGRAEEAEALFARALRIYTRHFGQEHVRTARMVSSYAEFQEDTKSREKHFDTTGSG